MTTSSSIVALLTGAFAFAASAKEEEGGISDGAIGLLAIALSCFVGAAVLALLSNKGATITRPSASSLLEIVTDGDMENESIAEQEHNVAESAAKYLGTLRSASDECAKKFDLAIKVQIAGLLFVGLTGFVTLSAG